MSMTYFDISEFDSPDEPGSGKNMDPTFLAMIDQAREFAGVPFKITSGWRSKARNRKVGGVPDSAHTRGFAADIAINDSMHRFNVLHGCIQAGFMRIGIADTFIHVDNDPDKIERVIWTY